MKSYFVIAVMIGAVVNPLLAQDVGIRDTCRFEPATAQIVFSDETDRTVRASNKGILREDHDLEREPRFSESKASAQTQVRRTTDSLRTEKSWFLDFEWGLGYDSAQISSSIPGLQFTTTGDYDWVYGDITTANYNVTSDNGSTYGGAWYFMSGHVFAWLGPDADVGRIDFLGGDGSSFTTGYCSSSDFYLEAYDAFDNQIDMAIGPPNTTSWGGTGLDYLTVTSASNNIAYVLMHDTGNQWCVDNMSGDDSNVSEPSMGSVFGTVVSAGSGNPVVGASVFISGFESHSIRTNGNGDYVITDVMPGSHEIYVWANGFISSEHEPIEILDGQSTQHDFALTPRPPQLDLVWWALEDVDDCVSNGDHGDLALRFFNRGGEVEDIEIILSRDPNAGHDMIFWDSSLEAWQYSVSMLFDRLEPFSYVDISLPVYMPRQDCDYFPAGSDMPGNPVLTITSPEIPSLDVAQTIQLCRLHFDPFTLPPQYEIGTTMLEEDCIRHPISTSISSYAQYATGNPHLDSPHLDPDLALVAMSHLCSRIMAQFPYTYMGLIGNRQPDIDMIKRRYQWIGVCVDFMDLSTGLLRSLGLQTRDVFGWFPKAGMLNTGGGHAWNEVLIGEDGTQDNWVHYDANKGITNAKDFYSFPNPLILDWGNPEWVYADIVPLSNRSKSSFHHESEFQGVTECNPNWESSYDCNHCGSPDFGGYECAENVTAQYEFASPKSPIESAEYLRESAQLAFLIDAPVSVERDSVFQLTASLENDSEGTLYDVLLVVCLSPWAADSLGMYSTPNPQVTIDSLVAGEADTVSWTVTALKVGHAIPLIVYAYDSLRTFYQSTFILQAVNEPSTLPDLALIAQAATSTIGPGEVIGLTASVFNDTLQIVPDAFVTAHVVSETNPGLDETVELSYFETDSAYMGELLIPSSAPLGDCKCTFACDRTGFDPDSLVTYFSITPLLSLEVWVDSPVYHCRDSVTVLVLVEDREEIVDDAIVKAEVQTPLGSRSFSMETDSAGVYHLSFVPAELAPYLGDTTLAGGVWSILVWTDYYSSYGSDMDSFTVHVPDLSLDSSDMRLYPPEPSAGEMVLITSIVRNLGNAVSDSTACGFYISQADSTYEISAEYSVPSLAPGDSSIRQVVWRIPELDNDLDICVRVDAHKLSVDSDRSNNVAFISVHSGQYICGDADASGGVDIDDVVFLINYIFAGGPAPEPPESGDADCSGDIDIDDVVYLINYIFAAGNAPCDPDGDGEPDC